MTLRGRQSLQRRVAVDVVGALARLDARRGRRVRRVEEVPDRALHQLVESALDPEFGVCLLEARLQASVDSGETLRIEVADHADQTVVPCVTGGIDDRHPVDRRDAECPARRDGAHLAGRRGPARDSLDADDEPPHEAVGGEEGGEFWPRREGRQDRAYVPVEVAQFRQRGVRIADTETAARLGRQRRRRRDGRRGDDRRRGRRRSRRPPPQSDRHRRQEEDEADPRRARPRVVVGQRLLERITPVVAASEAVEVVHGRGSPERGAPPSPRYGGHVGERPLPTLRRQGDTSGSSSRTIPA